MKKRIPLSQVHPNPSQPRKTFEANALRDLANSIGERGLMQAITVRQRPGGIYEIVGGERRWRAHCLLAEEGLLGKKPTILCEVVDIDDDEMALQAIVENLARADLRPIEEAKAFQAMLDRGWTVQRLAKDLGLSQPRRITDRTALLNLAETIQTLVDSGAFPLGHANYIADLPQVDQVNIVRLFSAGKLKDWAGVRAAAQAVRDRIAQAGMFDHENRPEPTKDDVAAMNRMERMVERIVSAIASGFRDGELIAIKTVDPNRADHLADTLAQVSRTARAMEAQLREAHARTMLM
ncbi:ParB family chromosome partitioning protein [Pseudaminobacter salicylatoxidans]|uniref:ParB family chromosome partitioning protein n=1 Tax=Pseudaminobacter salicylatoxidans TaxID=93369 RepID=A0A316C0M7_PSESE|nr:ParB/RepB/Spo0J family partition protein [Pseudaminobacter salicylatoxidans]PWJ81531.1 ParB family chromosome partitioning protein [Pseudaminobacter salicylatoxidans]